MGNAQIGQILFVQAAIASIPFMLQGIRHVHRGEGTEFPVCALFRCMMKRHGFNNGCRQSPKRQQIGRQARVGRLKNFLFNHIKRLGARRGLREQFLKFIWQAVGQH